MITINLKEITEVFFNNKALQEIRKGTILIWEKIKWLGAWFRSNGYFRSEPW